MEELEELEELEEALEELEEELEVLSEELSKDDNLSEIETFGEVCRETELVTPFPFISSIIPILDDDNDR